MNLFINEKSWNRYAENIAIEDIHDEGDAYLPKEYDSMQEIQI